MPKFFINFLNSNGVLAKDDEGQDLPGLEEAVAAAMKSARESPFRIKFPKEYALEAVIIANRDGEELHRISAREVVPDSLK